MNETNLILGSVIMLVGVALTITVLVRSFRNAWALGPYERWALPAAGVGLILLGRWMIQ